MEPLQLTHDSLKRVAHMAEDMEETMEKLEIERDDLLGMYELKEDENTRLKNEIELLECKTDCLEHKLRGITRDNEELLQEADRGRASFTKFQVAMSVIIFAYGCLYGSFFCPA